MYQVLDNTNAEVFSTRDVELAEIVALASSLIHGRFHKVLNRGGRVPQKFERGRVDPAKFEVGPLLAP